ncbi:hypothetical protein V5799_027688 [Amblyomma americanum]|uniref:Uncharacterized protein n=1 Tax=Amblyomma americanum TaxID=6943 RepID=A0AAQ4DF04_AMBAM
MSSDKAESTCVWKDQLNFPKACTSMGPEDMCWLITELPAWNRILCELAYELVEPLPGKLRLQCMPYGALDKGPIPAVRDAASMVSRLLQHHICINDLQVVCTTDASETTQKRAAVPVRRRPASGWDDIRNVRHLEVKTCRAKVRNTLGCCCIPDEDTVHVCDLEDLKINSAGEWSVSAVVDALQSSVTLPKPEFFMYRSTSWARELFAALGANTSVKNLRIGFRGANAKCGDVKASALRKNASLLELDLRADVDNEFIICIAESRSRNATPDTLASMGATVHARGVLALSVALRTNKTLKQLSFATFKASIPETTS